MENKRTPLHAAPEIINLGLDTQHYPCDNWTDQQRYQWTLQRTLLICHGLYPTLEVVDTMRRGPTYPDTANLRHVHILNAKPYRRVSHVTVNATNRSFEEVAAEVAILCRQIWPYKPCPLPNWPKGNSLWVRVTKALARLWTLWGTPLWERTKGNGESHARRTHAPP